MRLAPVVMGFDVGAERELWAAADQCCRPFPHLEIHLWVCHRSQDL